MKRKGDKSAAILTIKEAGLMTKEGRKVIAVWLRKQASDFEKHGETYSLKRFTARFLYR